MTREGKDPTEVLTLRMRVKDMDVARRRAKARSKMGLKYQSYQEYCRQLLVYQLQRRHGKREDRQTL